jgi:hypothetical protein
MQDKEPKSAYEREAIAKKFADAGLVVNQKDLVELAKNWTGTVTTCPPQRRFNKVPYAFNVDTTLANGVDENEPEPKTNRQVQADLSIVKLPKKERGKAIVEFLTREQGVTAPEFKAHFGWVLVSIMNLVRQYNLTVRIFKQKGVKAPRYFCTIKTNNIVRVKRIPKRILIKREDNA